MRRTNFGKPPFKVDEGVRESYPDIDRLLKIMDVYYLTPSHEYFGKGSCPIQVSQVGRRTIGFSPLEGEVDSVWYGQNIKKAIKRGVIKLGIAYNKGENNSWIALGLTNNPLKRLCYGLMRFPRHQDILVYLHPKTK